jgi:molybdenum cofactor synthesis domain-containing protein
MSDRAFEGVYEDLSGKELVDQTEAFFSLSKRKVTVEKIVLPDDRALLTNKIKEYIDTEVDILFTTGGTGIGPRDITPDVVKPFLEKELDGLMDFIRIKYGSINYNAIISRSIAGVSHKTLVYCLPGSVKAVKEYFAEIKHTLFHSSNMINDIDKHGA